MADLLPVESYPSVRAALWVSLTTRSLPDATIALPIYKDEAVAWVIRQDADAADSTGDELAAAKRAAIYYAAYLLADALPALLSERTISYQYQRQSVDLAAKKADLLARAQAALDGYLDTDPDTDRYLFFTTAQGYRGR